MIPVYSLISTIGIDFYGKENYHEWFRKVKNNLIFNDLWDDVCENKDENEELE